MGLIIGQKEYRKFKEGGTLTRKEAILAHCYECNGLEGSNCDCMGKNCPIYSHRPCKS